MKIETVDELYALAVESQVTMKEACKRAKVAESGPPRWRLHKVKPRPLTLKRLENAITAIAKENGTLPEENATDPQAAP